VTAIATNGDDGCVTWQAALISGVVALLVALIGYLN
jgi:hypothetical protein